MLCTECKKEQEKRIPNEEKENAQPAEKVWITFLMRIVNVTAAWSILTRTKHTDQWATANIAALITGLMMNMLLWESKIDDRSVNPWNLPIFSCFVERVKFESLSI